MGKKITISVAIAAFNAEKNIKKLSEAILNQQEYSFVLKELIINSDSSLDKTVEIANNIDDKRVKVVDSAIRVGFAGTVASLAKFNEANLLLILNDDIIVTDQFFIENLIQPFLKEKNIGLVCANAKAIKSNIFVSEAVRSGFNVFKKLGEFIDNGNNVYTADGKSLCLSQKFIKTIKFPKDYAEMANVDSYIYFTCKTNLFEYRYVKKSIIYFKCPSTINDFIKWQMRNYKASDLIIPSQFGDLAKKEYSKPETVFNYFKLVEFLKNPLGSILILFLGLYCKYKAHVDKYGFNKTWELVQTTKDV